MNPNSAAVLREVPVISYEAFVASAIRVFVPNKPPEEGGRIQMLKFVPRIDDGDDGYTATAWNAIQLIQFLIAQQSPKPGPVDWSTVPWAVQRHFRPLTEEESAAVRQAKKPGILMP